MARSFNRPKPTQKVRTHCSPHVWWFGRRPRLIFTGDCEKVKLRRKGGLHNRPPIISIPAEAWVGPIGGQTPAETLVYTTFPSKLHLFTTLGANSCSTRTRDQGIPGPQAPRGRRKAEPRRPLEGAPPPVPAGSPLGDRLPSCTAGWGIRAGRWRPPLGSSGGPGSSSTSAVHW